MPVAVSVVLARIGLDFGSDALVGPISRVTVRNFTQLSGEFSIRQLCKKVGVERR